MGEGSYASVLRIEGDQVTLQVFQSTRGISTGDRVTFLNRQMQATYRDSLLGRRLSGAGKPIDGGPEIIGEPIDIGTPHLTLYDGLFHVRWCAQIFR